MHATHHSYAELRRQMHDALRAQNPQWVEPDGTSPICDDYERRFAELLDLVETELNHPDGASAGNRVVRGPNLFSVPVRLVGRGS